MVVSTDRWKCYLARRWRLVGKWILRNNGLLVTERVLEHVPCWPAQVITGLWFALDTKSKCQLDSHRWEPIIRVTYCSQPRAVLISHRGKRRRACSGRALNNRIWFESVDGLQWRVLIKGRMVIEFADCFHHDWLWLFMRGLLNHSFIIHLSHWRLLI